MKGNCQSCGVEVDYLSPHHIVPRSKGGSSRKENIACLCQECHAAIHGRTRRMLWDSKEQNFVYKPEFDPVRMWCAGIGIDEISKIIKRTRSGAEEYIKQYLFDHAFDSCRPTEDQTQKAGEVGG